jgi:hypothetical protein
MRVLPRRLGAFWARTGPVLLPYRSRPKTAAYLRVCRLKRQVVRTSSW